MKPGIYSDIPNDEYHRGPGISKSGLDLVHKSPIHYHAVKTAANDNARTPTPAQAFGTAFHMLLLEPQRFADSYAPEPVGAPRRPTRIQREAKKPSPETLEAIDWWDSFEESNAGRELLDADSYDRLQRMRDAAMANAAAGALLGARPYQVEQSFYWTDPATGELCRCRPDIWRDDDILGDVKSTLDASPDGFAKSVFNYRYHVQDPFYRDGFEACTGRAPRGFLFIAVEKDPPFATAVYSLDPEAIELGRVEYQRDLARYAECRRTGQWPGYGETIQRLSLPRWAYTREG